MFRYGSLQIIKEVVLAKYVIGDYVLYGLNGSCQVVDIGPVDFADSSKIYYHLKPVSDMKSTIFVSMKREDDIIRRVISADEADKILGEVKKVGKAVYTPKREACDLILKSGDDVAISQMIKLLRYMRKENRKIHKSLNIMEEKILKDAERVFFSEMATALSMSIEEVVAKVGDTLDV